MTTYDSVFMTVVKKKKKKKKFPTAIAVDLWNVQNLQTLSAEFTMFTPVFRNFLLFLK